MAILIALAVLFTSFISGILGMAGGLILMGVFSLLLPVTSAMILHGVTQAVSNGYRAILHRKHIQIGILLPYLAGALISLAGFTAVQFVPEKRLVLVVLGLFPVVSLVLPQSLYINILRRRNALLCGLMITSTQILAGASGPLLDLFYIQSPLNRFQIIATKAVTQSLGHLLKLIYYAQILHSGTDSALDIAPLFYPVVVASALAGTRLGKVVLSRLSERRFRRVSRAVIVLIGIVYVVKGLVG